MIITIDTLRADALSIYGNRIRSNFFEDIASKSIVFHRAFTPVPITLPAHTSLLTGLYPPAHGVRNNGTFRASPELMLLSEIAQQQGMTTAAFIGAFPLASQFGLNQGFHIYDDTFSAAPESTTFIYAEKSAEQVRFNAQSWISSIGNKPFFLWMHLFDPHHPYLVHDRSANHPYLQEVLYVDQQLGLFFDFLRTRDLLRNTLVILTSDHGEAFGEHGEVSHSMFVYNTTLHVPLVIAAPGFKTRKRDEVVRLIDIYPTVVELMKWSSSNKVDGRSLVPLLRGETLPAVDSYSETLAPALDFGWSALFSIQTDKAKYIEAPKPEFYNLQQDHKETRNLIGTVATDQYRSKLQTILANKETPNVSAPALSREDREKLESLGYVSSGNQQPQTTAVDPKDRIEIARQIASLAMSETTLAEKAKAYQTLVRSESSNPMLLLRYAEILLKLKRFKEAGKEFKKVIDLKYPSAAAYNGLASVYFQQNQISQAREILESAVAKKLADGETHYNLGEFYLNQGLQEKAFQSYDASMKFHFLPAFYRKARLQEILGNTEEALRLLEQAKQLNPSAGETHFHAGMIHFRHQRFVESVKEFEQVLKKQPDAKWILYNIGVAYHRMGDREKSEAALQAFLRDAPPEMREERAQAQKLLNSL